MRSSPGDLALLDATEEVEIETRAADGAIHRTVVWVVVDGEEAFLRSYRGASARWYVEALARPVVAIHLDGRRLPATIVPATDPDAVGRTSTGLARKYARDSALPAMLRDEVLDTTLRLDAS